ncbi:serine hydrolase [Bernardetia sp.]|uniref:serine hydrolase n=1 Tax=Bernardetia sp. TaxID=1937974 RepID=UPI0025BD0048|nr:serine hydrolase [Bernardetia sp.]
MKFHFSIVLPLLFVCLFCFGNCFAQKIRYDIDKKRIAPLPFEIEAYLKERNLNLTVGISVIKFDRYKNNGGFERVYSNTIDNKSTDKKGAEKFPTMSVYKFHLALAVLSQVDEGKFKLNEKLIIQKSDILENTYSPLREDLKKEHKGNYEAELQKGVSIPLTELLSYMVSKSDNNACDILFRLLGGENYIEKYQYKRPLLEAKLIQNRKRYNQKGVQKTNNFIKKLGLKNTTIAASEEKMHEDFQNQYLNTTTPLDATLLLRHFYKGNILKKETHDFLWKILVETQTGSNKIKAGLPQSENIVLGHKTGSSFRKKIEGKEFGLKAAENDIGIVETPNSTYAIAIFIKNSTESNEINAGLIEELSKKVFEAIH